MNTHRVNISVRKMFYASMAIVAILMNVFCAQPSEPGNSAPIVLSMTPTNNLVNFQESITILADVKDADGDSISFLWMSDKGNFVTTTLDSAVWNAPDTSGSVAIRLRVNDNFGGFDEDSTVINVNNQLPTITSLTASQTNVMVGNIIILYVVAQDPDGEPLTYNWEANSGDFIGTVSADSVIWRASTSVQDVAIRIKVTDSIGDFVYQDIVINVFQETGSVWVADTFNDEIVKMSSNGTQLYRISGFSRPSKLALDLNDRSLWVADKGNNRLVKYSDTGQLLFEVTGIDRPTGVAVQSNGNVWVTTMHDSIQVVEISYTGTLLRGLKGFDNPKAIDINALTGDIWITDSENNRVVLLDSEVPDKYNIDSTAVLTLIYDTKFVGYSNPEGLVVDQATGNCWIADTGNHRVVRISAQDQQEFVISGFQNPRGIDVNVKDGSCWVANTGDNEVIKIFPEVFQLPLVLPWAYNIDQDAGFHSVITGYTLPWSISVNSSDNIVWFSDDFRVVKVKDNIQTFAIVTELTNFNSPRSLIVNTGIKP